jgi:hypothetical protein
MAHSLLRGAGLALGGVLGIVGLYVLVNECLVPALWWLVARAALLGDGAVLAVVLLAVSGALWGIEALERWWRGGR